MPSLLSPNPGEEVKSIHIRQFVNLSTGATGGGQVVKYTQLDDVVNPQLSVRNVNAAGQPLRVYETIASVDYELLSVYNASNATPGVYVGTSFYQKGPRIFDHMAFSGATDTDKINNALAYIRANCQRGAVLRLNKNFISLTDSVNATHIEGLTIEAAGSAGSTTLYGSGFSNATTSIIDLTGSRSFRIKGITAQGTQSGSIADVGANRPACGFLIAPSVDETSNKGVLEGCGTWGYFNKAAVYAYGSSNLTLRDCAFQNYGTSTTAIFTRDNVLNVTTLNQTIKTGSADSASDLLLDTVEIHYSNTTTPGVGLALRGVANFSWTGGVSDCYQNTTYHATLATVSGNKCTNVAIKNVRFYRDSATSTAAAAAVYVTGGDTVDGLSLINNEYEALGALVSGGSGITINNLVLLGDHSTFGLSSSLVTATTGTNTVSGGMICGDGLQINLGASGVIGGGIILSNVSGVTAATNNAIWAVNDVLRVPGGSNSVPSISSHLDTNTGLAWDGSDNMGLSAGGTRQLNVSTAGIGPRRIVSSAIATGLSTGNFSVSAGWGTSASCSAVTGTEVSGTFTITAGSGSVSANPTVTFTFPGGAYATAPRALVMLVGGTGGGANVYASASYGTSTLTMQMFFTPTINLTYQFCVLVIG